MNEGHYIFPQPGPQTRFLQCAADIAIYGGAAGGGKTTTLLMEAAYHLDNENFDAVTFRRTTPQITNPGGLWDAACLFYPDLGMEPVRHRLEWKKQHGLRHRFAHLENEETIYDWQGAQIPLIQFDELTHFTPKQFWYMLSRNRSLQGIPGRIRATTNPDADSWVSSLVEWYIGAEGLPIPERAGQIRWFARDNDSIIWSDYRSELRKHHADNTIMSFAFIPARVQDNVILMKSDPAYISRLNALSYVDRQRLLHGNWKIRTIAGNVFRRDWFSTVDASPAQGRVVRYWDRASSKPKKASSDPDWTSGVRIRRCEQGRYIVEDVMRLRDTPFAVQRAIKNAAQADGHDVEVMLEQDPGQAGVSEVHTIISQLEGFNVRSIPVHQDKITRAKLLSAQAEAGNVSLLRGLWNEPYKAELENFPEGSHDDQVDASSGAFNVLANERHLICV